MPEAYLPAAEPVTIGVYFKDLDESLRLSNGDLTRGGNDVFFGAIGQRGASVFLMSGGGKPAGEFSSYPSENGLVAVGYPVVSEGSNLRILEPTQREIRAVRSRVPVPASFEESVPVFNGLSLRGLLSKVRQHELFGDRMPGAVQLPKGIPMSASMLDGLYGDTLVVKPNAGGGARNVRIVSRAEVECAVEAVRAKLPVKSTNKDLVIEEYVPGEPWNELVAADEESAALLARAGAGELDTELRLDYFIVRDKLGDVLYAGYEARARLFEWDADGKQLDKWAHLVQSSVPTEAQTTAMDIALGFLTTAGALVGHVAVDLIKNKRGAILLREGNVKDPDLTDPVKYPQYAYAAHRQRSLLATALVTAAGLTPLGTRHA